MKSKLDKILYWFELAVYDMETARAMLKTRRYLYVGFMCHQVIEKSLKAYYWYRKGAEPPYSHNLLLLAGKSGIDPVMTDEQRKLLYTLMPLNIKTRYPDDKEMLLKSLTYNRCRSIVKETEDLKKWIKKQLLL
ncbi:MAG: hypothetical protein AUJ54_14510 [Ignavibacteria bacterium CG1_02_37_35]|nr:MAG: hypothetical protein AUJ54_14510 [Ignavibacteria bacterium CG1_02_37_35]